MHQYYIAVDGQKQGPFSLSELIQKRLSADTLVWRDNLTEWKKASDLPELASYVVAPLANNNPPPLPVNPPPLPNAKVDVSANTNSTPKTTPNLGIAKLGKSTATDTETYLRKKFFWALICTGISIVFIIITTIYTISLTLSTGSRTRDVFEGTRELMNAMGAIVGLGSIAFAAGVVAIVFFCQMLYRFWCIAYDAGVARTEPGKAVGFLFIPFFNFYWVFVSLRGLCLDYNRYCETNGINNYPRANDVLALITCILFIAGILPEGIGAVASLGSTICWCILFYQLIKTATFVHFHLQNNNQTDLSRHFGSF